MTNVAAEPLCTLLRNTKERLRIAVTDDAGTPVTPSSLGLRVVDLADNVLHVDAFPNFQLTGTLATNITDGEVVGTGTQFQEQVRAGDTLTFLGGGTQVVDRILSSTRLVLTSTPTIATSGTASKATRIVNPSAGVYYIDWGDPTAPNNLPSQVETAERGTFVAVWSIEDSSGVLDNVAQTGRIITPKTLSLLPGFRKLIDKSVKLVDEEDQCFLGYTDAQLIQYLEEGLTLINAYEPYPVWGCVDDFPQNFVHVLYQSALVAGVMSQQLFAIDTDIPNFSDQGNSFVIQHAPQLAAALNQIIQQLDKIIPLMKLKFVQTGSLHIQAGNNFRLAQLLQAAPAGALFRNVYFRGS